MSSMYQADYFNRGGGGMGTSAAVVDNLLSKSPKEVNYMLFMKAPNPGDDKKLKAEKDQIMAMKSQEE